MKVKEYFEWLISEMVTLEITKSPRAKEARLLSKTSSKLYRCLSDTEKEVCDKILNNIDEIMSQIRQTEEAREIKEAINIVKKYL